MGKIACAPAMPKHVTHLVALLAVYAHMLPTCAIKVRKTEKFDPAEEEPIPQIAMGDIIFSYDEDDFISRMIDKLDKVVHRWDKEPEARNILYQLEKEYSEFVHVYMAVNETHIVQSSGLGEKKRS